MKAVGTARLRRWLTHVAETAMITASIVYVMTGAVWALLVWEMIASVYLLVGAALVLRLSPLSGRSERRSAGESRKWVWVLPLAASLTGVNSAVIALSVRDDVAQDLGAGALAAVACVGVVLSWLLLHAGFADVYRHMSLTVSERSLVFPGTADPSPSDFIYFSFAIGATFATSDVEVVSSRVRRAVTAHSVAAFFYNALVVAIAIQVLQGILSA